MEDIYDIKTILFGFIYSYHYFAIILSLIFFVIFYFILEKFFKKKKFSEIIELPIENKKSIRDKFYEELELIEKNIDNYSKEEFYEIILNTIKDILYNNYQDIRIYKMTLKEIKNNFNPFYLDLIKEVYIKKFNDDLLDDSLEKRKNIIEKTKEVLKINF